MTQAFIAFGSNLGDKINYIKQAIFQINQMEAIDVIQTSTITETAPVGPPQDNYLNGMIEITTTLNAHELLKALQTIELNLDRKREIHWGPRTIDLDIISFGDEVIQTKDLTIPPALMQQRDFVLEPLQELKSDWVHPVTGMSVRELLFNLNR